MSVAFVLRDLMSTLSKKKTLGSKQPNLGYFQPKGWVNSGQNTCWVHLTQQIGLLI